MAAFYFGNLLVSRDLRKLIIVAGVLLLLFLFVLLNYRTYYYHLPPLSRGNSKAALFSNVTYFEMAVNNSYCTKEFQDVVMLDFNSVRAYVDEPFRILPSYWFPILGSGNIRNSRVAAERFSLTVLDMSSTCAIILIHPKDPRFHGMNEGDDSYEAWVYESDMWKLLTIARSPAQARENLEQYSKQKQTSTR